MEAVRDPRILTRASAAFDLGQTAEDMMRQSLRRRRWYSLASEEQIQARFVAWLEKLPYVEAAQPTVEIS